MEPVIVNLDRETVESIVHQMLAAELACDESALLADGVVVTAFETRPGRRAYPPASKALQIVTTGRGVVVTTDPDRLNDVTTLLRSADRDEIFGAMVIAKFATLVERDGQLLSGPWLRYICSTDRYRAPRLPDGIEIEVIEADQLAAVYRASGASAMMLDEVDAAVPHVLGTVAKQNGQIVGIAGASNDTDRISQIGVEVSATARGGGVGRALVGRLTTELFARGRVPYYSTAVSNIGSRSIALGLGYWPAWTDLYVQDAEM